jgi:hypothetical protein
MLLTLCERPDVGEYWPTTMKGILPAGVLGILSLAAGCGPELLVLHSNHYRIVVPPDWNVGDAPPRGPGASRVLRVPAAKIDPGSDGLELRVYGWVDTTSADEATAQALGRLALADDPAMIVSRDGEGCQVSQKVWLLGEYRPAVYLRDTSNRLLLLAAGKAAGSVVAVVGTVRPNGQSLCDNMLAVGTAMTKLGTVLTGSGDFTRAPRPRVELEQPQTGAPIAVPPLEPAPRY